MTTKRLSALAVEGVGVGVFAAQTTDRGEREAEEVVCEHTGKIAAVQM